MNLKLKLHAQTCEPMARIGRITLSGVLLAGFCLSIIAEEQVSFSRLEVQAMSASCFSAPPHFTLSLEPEPYHLPLGELLQLTDDWRLNSLFQKVAIRGGLDPDRSIMLFRKQIPSRYSYHAWAGLGTGYGQFFPSDTFGRSRTNGVGVKDPDWLYFKMTFRF